MLSKIKERVCAACVFFTVITIAAGTTGAVVTAGTVALTMKSILCFLFFSVLLSVINLIFRAKLKMWQRVAIHFLGTAAAFYLVFILFLGFGGSAASTLVIMSAFIAVYFVAALIILSVLHGRSRKKKENVEYSDQFSGIGAKKGK